MSHRSVFPRMRAAVLPMTGVILAVLIAPRVMAGDSVDGLIATVKEVDKFGKGNVEAQQAVKRLSQADPKEVPAILRGFAGANPLAENWLRWAVEVIAERAMQGGKPLPTDELEKLVLDRDQSPHCRSLAFECLARVDMTAPSRLVPKMLLDDPNREFRREAVAKVMSEAWALHNKNKKDQAADIFLRAFSAAVDEDQVQQLARALAKLGKKVDMQRHYGVITHWHLIGPFDNRKKIGFQAVYPPETEVNLEKSYPGQLGEVKWMPYSTDDNYGLIDIAERISDYRGAAMYAFATFDSSTARDVEFRLATPNAWLLWLNGKKLFAKEEYHKGAFLLDQYSVRAQLDEGRNTILLKVLNDENLSFVKKYRFSLRVCDHTGVAVHPSSVDQPATTLDSESDAGDSAKD